jgi:hypothetical protein
VRTLVTETEAGPLRRRWRAGWRKKREGFGLGKGQGNRRQSCRRPSSHIAQELVKTSLLLAGKLAGESGGSLSIQYKNTFTIKLPV